MSNTSIEKRTLMVAVLVNGIMAFSGWLAYYYSNSQAVLLDGNFSFVIFLTTLIAIKISSIKSKRSATFPFGQYVYEALFSFLKGIMIIGLLLMALTENSTRIFHYLNGAPSAPLNTGVILIYTLGMVFLCFSFAFYCNYQNKKINYSSTILNAEYTSIKVDGFMSLGTGIALFSIGFIDLKGDFSFLHYIGDSFIVILLILLLGKGPFTLVRNSFIELAGGTLQNQADKQAIEKMIATHLSQQGLLKEIFISKTGSNYLVVTYVNAQVINQLGYQNMQQSKQQLTTELNKMHQNVLLEIVFA